MLKVAGSSRASDPIRAVVEIIFFDPQNTHLGGTSIQDPRGKYAALSYAWGGQPPDRRMLLDGKTMPISKTCEEALQVMRPTDPEDVLSIWVDAICINQRDGLEKNSQVAMMGEIFSRASRVNMWLGAETWESKDYFSFLHKTLRSFQAGYAVPNCK